MLLFSQQVMSDSLQPYGLQHSRLPCPLPSPKFMSSESVILSNHVILCHPLLVLPSIFPSIKVFSSESALCMRWPKYRRFSFSISSSMSIQGCFPLFRVDWLVWSPCCPRDSRVLSSATVGKYQFFGTQPSLWFSLHIRTWLLERP